MKLKFIADYDIGYSRPGDAGIDLRAAQDYVLEPATYGERYSVNAFREDGSASIGPDRILDFHNSIVSVNTGLRVEIPVGYFGLVVGRSGLAFKSHIVVAHAGTIESTYRGEIGVLMINLSSSPVTIKKGNRCAQLLILAGPHITEFERVESLSETDRGTQGFGSSGAE